MPSYNGYPNKATWLVSLWLDNDKGSYDDVRDMARDVSNAGWSVSTLADLVESYTKSLVEDECESNGLGRDLLNYALADVDWQYLANELLAEVQAEEGSDDNA